jgi:ABC-type cobalamin/Fe3+-siderophores transport system ATPase subunit
LTKLLEAEITGLAGSRKSHKIVFDEHLNVFWGLNGSGKTSLLRILQSALADDASSISSVAFETARVVFRSEDFNAIFERTIIQDANGSRRRRSAPPRDIIFHEESDFEITDETALDEEGWTTRLVQGDKIPYPSHYKHSYLPISRLNEVQERRRNRYHGQDYEPRQFNFEVEIEAAWRQYNSVSLEKIREIQQKGLADILSVLFQSTMPLNINDLFESTIDENEAHRLVVDFLIQQGMALEIDRHAFLLRYRHQPELQQVVRRISDVNEEIEKTTRAQRAFQAIIGDLYSGDKRIIFSHYSTIEVRTGRKAISVDGLSSGEKQLLRILLGTLGGETSPVLVDEPELSMHIDWQREIVAAMQAVNPGCQLVLATHSPEVVARVPSHQMFEL